MKKRRALILLIGLLCAVLLTSNVLAMSSSNYILDWFTPLTGGGGGEAASDNYAVNLTIGQTITGASGSSQVNAGLGYWRGGTGPVGEYSWHVYLPLIMRNP